ncbi:MAG: UvrD-helicase domain-containing protein [Bacteroidales bacterium]|nr:UvrD-helicase domain-containing protein [Bacteroidales bacterium]
MPALTVYKASAGSGKTFTLTAEYIAKLLGNGSDMHSHILAVTFTKKATAEMKGRILQELWDIAYNGAKGGFADAVKKRIKPAISDAELQERAQKAMHAIIHDYDFFQVKTIDSFFQSLLATLAHEMGLSAGFKVEIDDSQVLDEAVDNLMANIDKLKDITPWVLEYVRARIQEGKQWDATKEVRELAKQITKEAFLEGEEKLTPIINNPQRMGVYQKALKRKKSELLEKIKTEATAIKKEEENHKYASFSHTDWLRSFLNRMIDGSNLDEPSKGLQNRMGNASEWLKAKDKKDNNLLTVAAELNEKLKTLENYRANGLYYINSCNLTLRNLNALALLGSIQKEVETINDKNNRFMLAMTPILFNRLVGADDASFVFEKVGTTFKHVMIDEFQDTSTLQWGNFKHLLVEKMATGEDCLLVGDVKQGIYRFRNGDWNILNNIETLFPQQVEVNKLETNFRSAENIVAFNNKIFPKAAKLLDEQTGNNSTDISNIYGDVKQQNCGRPGGSVEVHFDVKTSDKKDWDENEPELMAQKIGELLQNGLKLNDMAILVRARKDIDEVLNYFSNYCKDIPIVSDEAFILSASTAVQTIIHAMHYMVDKEDTVAMAYVAHARKKCAAGGEGEWGESRNDLMQLIPKAFMDKMETLKDLSLYELCEQLIRLFELETMTEDAPYLFCFLDKVMEYMDDGHTKLEEFLTYWDETLYKTAIPAGEVDGIRILTIHKSKGLAFHTVLMPLCNWTIEKDNPNSLLWCAPNTAPYDDLPLVPIRPNKNMANSIYSKDYATEHLNSRIENLNLMYVAFTRARQNLFVWARVTETAELSSTNATVGELLYNCLNKENYTKTHSTATTTALQKEEKVSELPKNPLIFNSTSEEVKMETYEPHVIFRQSNSAKDFLADTESSDGKGNDYIGQGKVMHHIFSMIRTTADVENALTAVRAKGILTTDKEADDIRKLIEKSFSNPQAADWFSGTWTLHNECNILSRDNAGELVVRRPDRVMMKDGKTVVVDFKFGKAQNKYANQVREYCELLKRMGHTDVEGYLWYVYENKIDLVE